MSRSHDSDELVLADRLVNYSDALVAFAFLGVSGLGVVVADPDIRCSVAGATRELTIANISSAVVFTAVILLLRRWELELRGDSKLGEKVARYARWLHYARLIIVWVSAVLSLAIAFAARDGECEGKPAAARRSGIEAVEVIEVMEAEGRRYDPLGPAPAAPSASEAAALSIWPGRAPVG